MTHVLWGGFEGYRRLASALGPPGLEGPVRAELRRLLEPHAQVIHVDAIGNLYAHFSPGAGPPVMISAHMDEVAFVVRSIGAQGRLRVLPQGCLSPESLASQPVVVLGSRGPVEGRGELEPTEARPTFAEACVDVGATSRQGAEAAGIRLGDRICFAPVVVAEGPEHVRGKSADDRVGLFALSEMGSLLARASLPAEIVLVGTVQEEAAGVFAAWAGAKVAAERLRPALAIGVDTVACVPAVERGEPGIALDRPGIVRGAQDLHPAVVDRVLGLALAAGLPSQIVPSAATAADYTHIVRAGRGTPCAALAVPVKDIHTGHELFAWKALEGAVRLLAEILDDIDGLLRAAAEPG